MKTYTFTFTEEEAQTILNALAEMPFRLSANVIQTLQTQAQAQSMEPTEEKPKK